MKDKPVSHKSQNTFHFQTFAERLSAINIDVIHQIKRTSEVPEHKDTFFLETLLKWTDLNYTESFKSLRQDIGTDVQTLPQIVYKQKEIVQALKNHLQIPNNLALDATLELIVALARDLQYDFYSYFPEFFVLIVQLLRTKDTELLENLFTCLAFLFKFLWRYMVKDIYNVFSLFAPLMSNDYKEHIHNFAAESFGFLLRKASDKKKLFQFIFQKLEETPDQVEGIGQLLFEVIKSVKKNFHSCSEEILPIWMSFLGLGLGEEVELPYHLIEQTLTHTFSSMAQYTSKEYTDIVWKTFCDALMKLMDKMKTIKSEVQKKKFCDHLARVLNLFLHWVQYCDGKLMKSPERLIQILEELCKMKEVNDSCAKPTLQASSVIMLTHDSKLSMELIKRHISSIYASSFSRYLIFDFTRRMFMYGMFEKDVLPPLLEYCQKCVNETDDSSIKNDILTILLELVIHKQPLVVTGEDLTLQPKFYLDLLDVCNRETRQLRKRNLKTTKFESLLLDKLKYTTDILQNLPEIWASLVCLPHIRPLNQDAAVEEICKVTSLLLQKLIDTTEDCVVQNKIAFVLCQAVVACIHMESFNQLFSVINLESFISLVLLNPSSTCLLCIADVYLTYISHKENFDSTSLLDKIFEVIQPNLASPHHLIRLLTLRILNSFDYTLPTLDSESISQTCIFDICLAAEKVPITIHDYREKLKLIRKLEFNEVQKNVPNGSYKKVPLYYLLGMLYVNFQPLWKPTQGLINSHAHGMGKEFWEVLIPQLQSSSDLIEKTHVSDTSIVKKTTVPTTENFSGLERVFLSKLQKISEHSEVPDHINCRLQLWKCMDLFPQVVEPRNREIVPLLLRFVRNELETADTTLSSSEDVHCSNNNERDCLSELKDKIDYSCLGEAEGDNDLEEDEKGENSEFHSLTEDKEQKVGSGTKKKRRGTTKTLAACMSLFAKFQNPKAIHKEEELRHLYHELLSYRDPDIQKLAFDCIMTYNYKFLIPYKENFFRLLDDKTFKTEIVLFNLDSESDVVKEEHRASLLPVLMRIMYGKMLYKSGTNTSGRGQGHVRRSLVLRFLAGCKEDELQVFLDLAFAPFKDYTSNDALRIVRGIRSEISLTAVIPLRKQLSALNTMGTIFSYMGSLVPKLLPWLLKVLLAITTISVALLEKREEIDNRCINLLKSLRTQSIIRLIQFFRSFDHYCFTSVEIDAVFDAVIWPLLPRLEFEALHFPSPLLRLIATWCEFPRYFVLLSKQHPDNVDLAPLPHVMSLYTANKIQPRVICLITKMLDQLLSLQDYTVTEETNEQIKAPPLIVSECIPVLETELSFGTEPLNYGTKLLLPHVPHILKRLRLVIEKASKTVKKNLSERDLNILLRISEHVHNPDHCQDLIDLLIPFLKNRRNVNMEGEVSILSAISNLIIYVNEPGKFIRSVVPLFSQISHKQSRMALVSTFYNIGQKDNKLYELYTVVSKINAWNPKQMEEPDFDARLDGHKIALQKISDMNNEVDVNFILVIIYNSAFVIKQNEDLALRDSASYLLQQMTIKFREFVETRELFKIIVTEAFLSEIQKGIKNKTEVVRHEFLQILASLLNHCGSHPQLVNLSQLCDKDPDLDFWENIRHLQMHRRSRALSRFAQNIASKTLVIPPHLLTTYMLPITSSFLFDDAYKKYNHLIDSSIEAVGAICYCLPWHRYSMVLKHYLDLLIHDISNKKIVIRVVVTVLNAFHFDLSLSKGQHCNLKEPPLKKIKRKNDDTENNSCTNDDGILDIGLPSNEEQTECSSTGKDILDEEKATKIHLNITESILPQLYQVLSQKSRTDEEHKLAKHYFPEDEEILQAPLALAVVKLLQNLPHRELEQNLPGLFLKMCHFLKSRAESIRETTRETLIKMMHTLGSKYLWFLVKEMRAVMKKGFQVHVMTYTVHAVLTSLKEQLKYGDLDSCLTIVTEICTEELFGEIAEEKEVAKITGKLKEARHSKSYLTYQVLGQFITHRSLTDLILPLKEVLAKTHNHKIVHKAHECLHKIAFGLSENQGLSVKDLLIFTHGIMTDSIPELSKRKENQASLKKPKYERPDIYLIPKEPPRGCLPTKTSIKTNAHVITEFGLQLLQFYLRREKLTKHNQEHLEMLDPFIPLLEECLQSQHMKVITTTLRCLGWLLKFPLPSVKVHISNIVCSLFVLLNKYSGVGMAQGENFEMIVSCFKVLTVVVRDVDYYALNDEQLQVLLSYVEQDIYDRTRQSTAFTLMKAILLRKLQSSELSGVMKKIAEMSVTSVQDHIRTQCRQVYLQYLLEYPLGKQIKTPLSFFASQLEYEHESGRVSAIEMLNSIFACFPLGTLKMYAGVFFVPLAARLINEESSKCRRIISLAIKNLLSKLDDVGQNSLFTIVVTWMNHNKLTHKQLGVQLCGTFAEVEQDNFESHVDTVLPVFQQQLDPSQYENINEEIEKRNIDHYLYHLMCALSKIFTACSVVRQKKFRNELNIIWEHIQHYILHPHTWVRTIVSQLFGFLFSVFPMDEVISSADIPDLSRNEYLLVNTRKKLRDLSADFCTQLQSPYLSETLGEQIIRNIIYLAKVIRRLSPKANERTVIYHHNNNSNNLEHMEKEKEEEDQKEVSLEWLIRRLCREAKREVAINPKITLKRTCVFKFLAAISIDLGKEELTKKLSSVLPPLCRELLDSSNTSDSSLKNLTQEVLDIIRNTVTVEIFTEEYAKVQTFIAKKKAKRKQEKAVEAVVNPAKSAHKRIKRQLAKKEAIKRKFAKNKGRKVKKAKLSDMAIIS